MRTLLAVVVAAAAVGVAAPAASAKCSPEGDYVQCTINCLEGQIHGYLC